MTTNVTVWSKPSCIQCKMTHRALDAKGIEYDVFDVTDSRYADELRRIQTLGYMQAPIVEVFGFTVTDAYAEGSPEVYDWSGFRADLIDQIPARLAAAEAVAA